MLVEAEEEVEEGVEMEELVVGTTSGIFWAWPLLLGSPIVTIPRPLIKGIATETAARPTTVDDRKAETRILIY